MIVSLRWRLHRSINTLMASFASSRYFTLINPLFAKWSREAFTLEHMAKWLGKQNHDSWVLGSIPTASLNVEVLSKLIIPSCLCPPRIDGYLVE